MFAVIGKHIAAGEPLRTSLVNFPRHRQRGRRQGCEPTTKNPASRSLPGSWIKGDYSP
jgi:hypothetical protein